MDPIEVLPSPPPPPTKVPAAPKVKRERKPSDTIEAVARERGPFHVAALKALGKDFKVKWRAARKHNARLAREDARIGRLQVALDRANQERDSFGKYDESNGLAQLDALAASIKAATAPTLIDTDTTLDGSGAPLDTAPPRDDDE